MSTAPAPSHLHHWHAVPSIDRASGGPLKAAAYRRRLLPNAEEDLGRQLIETLVVEATRGDALAIERLRGQRLRGGLREGARTRLVASELAEDALDVGVGVRLF